MGDCTTLKFSGRPKAVLMLLGLCLVFLLSGCATQTNTTMMLTPVADPPTGVHHPGKFVWNDLLTDDVAKAKDFYGHLFGWDFKQLGGYTVISSKGRTIGGMVQIDEAARAEGAARWVSALSVSNVDSAVQLVTAQGGTVHEGPLEMLNRGRAALIADPEGAQLLLLHAADGDPEDREPEINAWLWHELWSNHLEDSLAFYQKLAGYDYEGEASTYLILTKDERWRAGIRYVPNEDLMSRWVPAVRVADIDATVKRAEGLGGTILVGPQPTPSGSVALIADASGALVIVQRWSATPEQEQ